jgi:hypothetical protein
MKVYIPGFIFCAFSFFGTSGQINKADLVTDRPDQTESPVLIPVGALQVETGFLREKDHAADADNIHYTYNTTLLKYGVTENLELRFINEYAGSYQKISDLKISGMKGFNPVTVGVKIKITDSKGIIPATAFIGHIHIKSGMKDFRPDYTAADFRFTSAKAITRNFFIGCNLGAQWDGHTPEATFLYTVSANFNLSQQLGVFVESYGFLPEKRKADHRFDCGLTYKLTKLIQWDISAGVGITNNAPDSFFSTGLSFRLIR